MNQRSNVKQPPTLVPEIAMGDSVNLSLPHLSPLSQTVAEDSFYPMSNSVIDRDEESMLMKRIPSKDITILGKECNDISWCVSEVTLFQSNNSSAIPNNSVLDRIEESMLKKPFPSSDITINGEECSDISWCVNDVSLFQTKHNSTKSNNQNLKSLTCDKTFNVPVKRDIEPNASKLISQSEERDRKLTDAKEWAKVLCNQLAFTSPTKENEKKIEEKRDIKIPSVERILEHLNSNTLTDMSDTQIIQGFLDLTVEDDANIVNEDTEIISLLNNAEISTKRGEGSQIDTTPRATQSYLLESGETEPPWISDFNRMMEEIEAGSLTGSTILDKIS